MNNPKSSEYKVSKTRKYKTKNSVYAIQWSKKKQLLTGQEKFTYIKLKGMQRSMTATTKRKTLS